MSVKISSQTVNSWSLLKVILKDTEWIYCHSRWQVTKTALEEDSGAVAQGHLEKRGPSGLLQTMQPSSPDPVTVHFNCQLDWIKACLVH